MSDHTYQKIEIVGSSPVSIEDAIQGAVARAAKLHSNINWFEVVRNPRPYLQRQGGALSGGHQSRLPAGRLNWRLKLKPVAA